MPESLTAENGAKGLLIGEFYSEIELDNPDHCGCGRCDCCIEGLDEDATYVQRVPVSWSTIKDIYAMAVKHLASGKPAPAFDMVAHLKRQLEWSLKTFGPGDRTEGVIDHICKELAEVSAKPGDLEEWIDVVILALDGAWRAGHAPEQIISQLVAKQAKNELRKWPDWRTAEPGKAIEHVKEE